MAEILLPPLPKLSANKHYYSADQLRDYSLEVARLVLEGAAQQVRDSGVCPFAVADGIAATEVKHHE